MRKCCEILFTMESFISAIVLNEAYESGRLNRVIRVNPFGRYTCGCNPRIQKIEMAGLYYTIRECGDFQKNNNVHANVEEIYSYSIFVTSLRNKSLEEIFDEKCGREISWKSLSVANSRQSGVRIFFFHIFLFVDRIKEMS